MSLPFLYCHRQVSNVANAAQCYAVNGVLAMSYKEIQRSVGFNTPAGFTSSWPPVFLFGPLVGLCLQMLLLSCTCSLCFFDNEDAHFDAFGWRYILVFPF